MTLECKFHVRTESSVSSCRANIGRSSSKRLACIAECILGCLAGLVECEFISDENPLHGYFSTNTEPYLSIAEKTSISGPLYMWEYMATAISRLERT